MTEGIKIPVGVNFDRGNLEAELDGIAKKVAALSSLSRVDPLVLDLTKFNGGVQQAEAAMAKLRVTLQQKTELGLDTGTATEKLSEFEKRLKQSSEHVFGAPETTLGQTPEEAATKRQIELYKQLNAEMKRGTAATAGVPPATPAVPQPVPVVQVSPAGAPPQPVVQAETNTLQRQQIEQYKQLNVEMRRATGAKTNFTNTEIGAVSDAIGNMAKGHSSLARHARDAASPLDLARDQSAGSQAAFRRALNNAGISTARDPKAQSSAMTGAGKFASAAGGVAAGIALGGAGGDGMATAGSALGGMLGSIGGIPGMMIGSAIGGMVGGAAGRGLGDAKDEAIAVTQLRHNLGSTTHDFEGLRDATRAAASGLGITYQESVKLAKQFAQGSNFKGTSSELAAEARLATSFSRSMGLDPSQGVNTMGALRNTRVTETEADSRRMAMIIADGINKGGMSSKSDEVMAAIANFAQTSARASLQTPNVTGYTGMLSEIVQKRTPGLDVGGSASLLGKMDAGIRSHGKLSTDVFKLGALQNAFGSSFNAMDMQLFTDNGLLGTARGTVSDLAKDKGARGEDYAKILKANNGNLDKAAVDLYMPHLEQYAPKGTSAYELSGASVFDTSQNEFRKFSQAYHGIGKGSSDGLKETLQTAGVNVNTLDVGKFMHLGSLAGSNRKELTEEANKLLKGDNYNTKLTDEEKTKLTATMNGDNEQELRNAVIKLNENRELIDTGTAVMQNTADLKNELTKLSSALLPAVESVREAILWGFGKQDEWKAYEQDQRIKEKMDAARLEAEKISKEGGKFPNVQVEDVMYAPQTQAAYLSFMEKHLRRKDAEEQAGKAPPAVKEVASETKNIPANVLKSFELLAAGKIKEAMALKWQPANPGEVGQALVGGGAGSLVNQNDNKTHQQVMATLSKELKPSAEKLIKGLKERYGFDATGISGGRTQEEQDELMKEWKAANKEWKKAGKKGEAPGRPARYSKHIDHGEGGNAIDLTFSKNGKHVDGNDKELVAAMTALTKEIRLAYNPNGHANHVGLKVVVENNTNSAVIISKAVASGTNTK